MLGDRVEWKRRNRGDGLSGLRPARTLTCLALIHPARNDAFRDQQRTMEVPPAASTTQAPAPATAPPKKEKRKLACAVRPPGLSSARCPPADPPAPHNLCRRVERVAFAANGPPMGQDVSRVDWQT